MKDCKVYVIAFIPFLVHSLVSENLYNVLISVTHVLDQRLACKGHQITETKQKRSNKKNTYNRYVILNKFWKPLTKQGRICWITLLVQLSFCQHDYKIYT